MTTLREHLVRFRRWLLVKRNMCLYGAFGFGVPLWLFEVWLTWSFSHTLAWVAFLGVVSLIAGVVWGWAMWHVMGRRRARRNAAGVHDQ